MADDEINPALVKLARGNPRQCFIQKGDSDHVIQWTSTCTDMPARWPVYTETQWTPMLYQSIAVVYARLQATYKGYSYKQRIEHVGETYGRSRSVVTKALSLFPKSE